MEAGRLTPPEPIRNIRHPFREARPVASYDFRCTSCDHAFTRHLPMRDLGRVKVTCPSCGSPKVERVLTAFYAKTIRKS